MALSHYDFMAIKDLLDQMEARMVAREEAAQQKFATTLETIKEGWAALRAENDLLKNQLQEAGVEFQAALDADSEADATKWEEAEAALDELDNQPVVEQPVEDPQG